MRTLLLLLLLTALSPPLLADQAADEALWLEISGSGQGPGVGKRIVLISGDEEYRSEELMPQLAKILATHHGFDCTVLFAIDPQTGQIKPDQTDNLPGLHRLAGADLMIIATRFRNLPDDQMQHLVQYIEGGNPIIGLRTATHAFNPPADSTYARYGWKYAGADYPQGFGRQVLGETWIAHHGKHGSESTRGIVADRSHVIATGIQDGDIWGPSDVYRVRLPLPEGSQVIFRGAILAGMTPDAPAVDDERNRPMMPIGWTRTYRGARVFTTTMGAATDFVHPGLRRMLVNASLWAVGQEDAITADLEISTVGRFEPTPFGFGGYVPGKRPADYR